jgi:hypothetical protein
MPASRITAPRRRRRRLLAVAAGLAIAATLAAAAPAAPAEAKRPKPGAYPRVGFDRLTAFEYPMPGPRPPGTPAPEPGRIPPDIRALDGRRLGVTGYMLPIRMEGELVREFALLSNPLACCYGQVPRANEWIIVTMTGPAVPAIQHVPLTFEGTLHVGEIYENGIFNGLYRLDGERLVLKR